MLHNLFYKQKRTLYHFVSLIFLLIGFPFYRFPSYSSSSTRHRCSQQRTCSLKIQPPASCLNYQLCNVLFTRLISVSPIHLRMKVIPPSSRSAPGLNPRAWLIIDYLWGEKAFLPENVVISHTQVFRVTFIHAFFYFFYWIFLVCTAVLFKKRINAGRPYWVTLCSHVSLLTFWHRNGGLFQQVVSEEWRVSADRDAC